MSNEPRVYPLNEAHSFFARHYNGLCWSYLAKGERSADETAKMVNFAHASLLHWSESEECSPANLQRGEFLVSLAYAYAGRGEMAYCHAKRCFDLTFAYADSMKTFDLAYAYMAMARASALIGSEKEAKEYLSKMTEAPPRIANSKDKEIFLGDLGAGPWGCLADLVQEVLRKENTMRT
jgi:hypothetical protein